MKLFSIINAATNIVFGRQKHTDTDREHIRLERASTFPVIYESHEPIVQCLDMSADAMSIDDEEFSRYSDLQDDIDVHNVSEHKSLILHDTLYVSCRPQGTYAECAHSKDLVYNTGTTLANELNAKKFGHDYKHKHPVLHVYYPDSNAHMGDDVSSVIETMHMSPVNMLNLARGAFGNVHAPRKSVSEVCNFLQNSSIVFDVDNYETTMHNVSSVSINTQRVLRNRKVCGLCVSAHVGYIPYIPVHNGTLEIIGYNCSTQMSAVTTAHTTTQSTTQSTTQRTFIQHSRAPLISAPREYISERTILLYTGLVSAGVAGIAICAVLFKPIKHYVRIFLGLTLLDTAKTTDIEDNEDNDSTVKMAAQTTDTEENDDNTSFKTIISDDNASFKTTTQVDIEDVEDNSDNVNLSMLIHETVV